MVRRNTFNFKELIRYLTTFWANCEPELEELKRDRTFPAIPTVYLLLYKEDPNLVKYVGQTSCLARRIAQHRASKKMNALKWGSVAYFVPGIKSLHRRYQVEWPLITLLVPEGNKMMAGVKKADSTWSEYRPRYTRKRKLVKI